MERAILDFGWSKITVIAPDHMLSNSYIYDRVCLENPEEYEDLIECMKCGARYEILYIVILYMLPRVLIGLRIAVSTAFAAVFIAEGFVLLGAGSICRE